jgi:hypothetical protein
MAEQKIWIPPRPNIRSFDSDPAKSKAQKIREIKSTSRVRVKQVPGHHNMFRTHLAHTKGATFVLEPEHQNIYLWDFDLGNRQLYGHGIGTRILQKVVDFGLKRNRDTATITRDIGNWAMVKTLGKVLGGDEYVKFELNGEHYGEGRDRPISAALEDFPPSLEEGEDYTVRNLIGSIDRSRLMDPEAAANAVRMNMPRLVNRR